MNKHLGLVCGALAGMTILDFSALAETAKPNATAAPLLPSPHHSKQTDKARRKLRRIATMNGEPIEKQ
jgi:hypothetical protein